MKVSVLIPVYNAESTLLSSLESIASQTYPEIELCVVDDCSTDACSYILSEFRKSFESIPGRSMKSIRQERNAGVAAARNALLDICTGDLICFVDADDHLEPQAFEKAIPIMVKEDADIVGWDWTLASDKGSRYMRQPDCDSPEEALKAMMEGTLRWNLWLFLFRRNICEGIRFLPGVNMGEDMTFTLRALMKSKKFSQIHESQYVYSQTSASISKSMTEGNLSDIKENVRLVESALSESSYSYLSDDCLLQLKLNLKLPLLVSRDKNDYIRWFECFSESNGHAMRNTHLPMRTKLLQWMAAKRFWTGVRIYNELIYGILYRFYLCGKL